MSEETIWFNFELGVSDFFLFYRLTIWPSSLTQLIMLMVSVRSVPNTTRRGSSQASASTLVPPRWTVLRGIRSSLGSYPATPGSAPGKTLNGSMVISYYLHVLQFFLKWPGWFIFISKGFWSTERCCCFTLLCQER